MEYAWVDGYIYMSWDFWPFRAADWLADHLWFISSDIYKDNVDAFMGLGVTSYEGTMGIVLALMEYQEHFGEEVFLEDTPYPTLAKGGMA